MRFLLFAAVLASALDHSSASAQRVVLAAPEPAPLFQPESNEASPLWVSVGAGLFEVAAHLGLRDVFAQDVNLRLDGFLAGVFLEGAVGGGGALHVVWMPGSPRFQPYIGAGLEVSRMEEIELLCGDESSFFGDCSDHWQGTYVGGSVLAGLSTGGRYARYFVEAGVSVSTPTEAENDAPSVAVRPRLVMGVSFL
ncbi:MAG: hypothetical protein AAGF12_23275 [Myxococcota bacterium]